MILLFNPLSSASRKPVLPMSLLALGALLEEKYDYRIIDGNLEDDSLEVLSRVIEETGADILALTVMPGPQLNHAVPLCRRLKTRHPELKIIWGGYFPTQHFDVCLRAGYVDYVVRGYGEYVFQALIDALKNKKSTRNIPSLAYIDIDTHKIVSNPAAPMPDPDKLPDFPYNRIETRRYIRKTFMGSRTLSHHSSYGCPFSCHFCAVTCMAGGRWLAQSAERIANTVGLLKDRFDINAIEFYDNSFFIDEKRTADFAARIIPMRLGWWAEARIDVLSNYSEDTWTLLRDSGLKMVFMGAEAGSDELLERMNKGGTAAVEKTLFIVEKMRRYGIVPELSFVLGNPPDPGKDVRQAIDFIRRVKKINPQTEIICYMYTPVPKNGTLYDEARHEGFRFPETLEGWVSPRWQSFSQRRNIYVPRLQDTLARHVRNFEYVLNACYPTATNPRLKAITKGLLKAAGAWRYHLRFYSFPLELKVLQEILAYRRPETSGC